jgi:hypothetical protein
MAITAIAADAYPLERCQSLDVWYRGHKCPPSGSGQRLVHKWILSAANACKHFGLTAEQAADWLEVNMSRRPDSNREIRDQIEFAYGSPVDGKQRQSQPQPQYDPSKLERRASRIDAEITRGWLQKRSPMRTDITTRPSF